jgi:DNA-binding LacI/PurR family transcriptional regulator
LKKRVTIKDVAARAGVAYQTVSKVINGTAHVMPETEARIWDAARELSYKRNPHARNLRVQRSHMLGYSWVFTWPEHGNHILDVFLTSMVEEAEAAGYHLLPFPYREGDRLVSAYRELIDSGRVDGFVLSSVNYDDARIAFLQERQFPFVAFGRERADATHAYVDIDGAAGMRCATEHLIGRGHRRIAALSWPQESRVGDDRLAGYRAALQAAGLDEDPGLISRAEGSFAAGQAATRGWMALPAEVRPTAIIAVDDILAIGAMRAIQESGLTPGQDVDVIGFDDTPMARFMNPPLSSVRQPLREAGRKCVELLVTTLAGRKPANAQVLLAPELIVRQSSGAPAG